MRRRLATPLAALLVVLALVAMTALPAAAGNAYGHAKDGSKSRRGLAAACAPIAGPAIEVLHGPVTISLANPDSDGHQVGDLRATTIETTDVAGAPLGRLDATLTTTSIDTPAPGDEIRISTLVFVFGDDGTDQIVVGGSAVYPAEGPTLAEGSVTTRPIQGGSGRFAGALGSAVSEHFPDGSWRHTLNLTGPHAGGPLATISSFAVLDPSADRSYRFRVAPDRLDRDVDPSRIRGLLRALWSRLADPGPDEAERGVVRRIERARPHRVERAHRRLPVACAIPVPAPVEPPTYEGLQGAPIEEPGITRAELGRTLAAGVEGQELGLWHYTVPVGAVLEPHTHAGSQIARVIRGALTYTVIAGDGTIIASDGTTTPIGPGTYVLRAGDSVVEDPDLEHFGSNDGPEVVELIAATLYPEGAPLSIPLETPEPAASAVPAADEAPAASPTP